MENILDEWARYHRVPHIAMQDLLHRLTAVGTVATMACQHSDSASESRVSSQVRLEAAQRGDVMLFRNNVGSLQDAEGNWVRYGLANESKRINEQIKSADLIGVYRYVVQPQDVGRTIGQFVSVETKRANWTPNMKDPHTKAQMAWAALMSSYGAFATFAAGQSVFNQLRRF